MGTQQISQQGFIFKIDNNPQKPKEIVQKNIDDLENLQECIRRKANEISRERGGQNGIMFEDWLNAEKIVLQKIYLSCRTT